MSRLIEIHASFIGIGKSTFMNQTNYARVDDCVDLVSCFDGWYGESIVFDDAATDDILKAMLVMEHTITKIVAAAAADVVLTSRSPVLSALQFLPSTSYEMSLTSDPDTVDTFIRYYKTRLNGHIEKVVVLDYGDVVCEDEAWIRLGYERMSTRNRKMETDFFVDYDTYKQFFETCERKKNVVVEKIKRDSFFEYLKMSTFNGFDSTDLIRLHKILHGSL